MKILVTGSAGFLGQRILALLSDSSHQIFPTDKFGPFELLGNLSDTEFVNGLPDVDVVINCSAVQYVTKNKPLFFRKKYFMRNNVNSIVNLVNRYENVVTNFIHIGTSMQYFQNKSKNYNERSPMASQGIYSESKLKAQIYLDTRMKKKSATILPCIIGGVGREGIFRGFTQSISRFSIAIIPGKGNNPISMVHVDDVAKLVLVILKHNLRGYYNAAGPDALTINEWAAKVGQLCQKRKIIILRIPLTLLKILSALTGYRILAREQLSMLSMPHVLDTTKSDQIFNDQKIGTREIISDIVKHFRKN